MFCSVRINSEDTLKWWPNFIVVYDSPQDCLVKSRVNLTASMRVSRVGSVTRGAFPGGACVSDRQSLTKTGYIYVALAILYFPCIFPLCH